MQFLSDSSFFAKFKTRNLLVDVFSSSKVLGQQNLINFRPQVNHNLDNFSE